MIASTGWWCSQKVLKCIRSGVTSKLEGTPKEFVDTGAAIEGLMARTCVNHWVMEQVLSSVSIVGEGVICQSQSLTMTR